MEMPSRCLSEGPPSSQGCQSCFRLQKELRELKEKLYHKPRLVPDQLWDIIPPAGNYIKNIMKFSGYETIDSVATLKRKDELDKMFRFVRSMSEIVEDKSQIFGIFSKNPQRVMVIPGLEPAVNKFLSAVDRLLKAEGTDTSKQLPSNPVAISPLNSQDSKPCYTSPLCTPSPISGSICRDSVNPYDISNIISRMEQWIFKQPGAVDKLLHLGFEPVNVFRITENEETKDYHFECLICHKHISMQTVSRKGVSLSNAMRHITRICWLTNRNKDPNAQPAKVPKLRSSDQKPISNFNDRNFFDETRCSFVLGDVEEASSDTQNSDQSDSQKGLNLPTDQAGHTEDVAAAGDAP